MNDLSSQQRDAAFTIAPEPVDSDAAKALLARYESELGERFSEIFDSGRAAPPAAGDFAPPVGVFLVVRAEGRPAGCGALRTERTETGKIGEIRRMWIAPELRGKGAGRALLTALERQAQDHGCHAIRMDTAEELREAKALYDSAGYREIPAYNDNQYARHWFEKLLG